MSRTAALNEPYVREVPVTVLVMENRTSSVPKNCSQLPPDRADALTPRQRELLGLVAQGRSTREVANQLFLAPGTVRKHLDNIFERLGVSSRLAAITQVFPDGFVPSAEPNRQGPVQILD